MKRIVAVLHEPEGGYRGGLYDVTYGDGKNQWNAHLTSEEYEAQRHREKIHDAVRELWVHARETSGWERPTWEKVWEPIEEAMGELSSLAYRDGAASESEAQAGASL